MPMNDLIITIENQRAEVDAETKITMGATFLSTSSNNEPRLTISQFTLPITPCNRQIMQFADQCAAPSCNRHPLSIIIEVDDRVLLDGQVVLHRVERQGEGGRYVLKLRPSEPNWREITSQRMLEELPIEWSGKWDADTIVESWSDDTTPVRFLPVSRNAVSREALAGNLLDVTKSMAFDNYHPFLHLRTVIKRIFKEAGYSFESIFMSSSEFEKLYMSGAYPVRRTSEMDRRFGFLARRRYATSVEADFSGTVYASPLLGAATIGNIVDADCEGAYADTYVNGNSLRVDEYGRVVFVPTSPVVASFVYELRYRTDYKILTRDRLRGFDQIWLSSSDMHSFVIENTFEDCRGKELLPRMPYNLIVFNHKPNQTYRLIYSVNGISREQLCTQRSTIVTLCDNRDDVIDQEPVLAVSTDGGQTFAEYVGDWAMYDGVVSEYGTTEVSMTLRSTPEIVKPGSPKLFDTIAFNGAEEGMTLRMNAGVSVRPIFFNLPTDDITPSWRDVSAVGCSQADVVDAVCAMFNLRVEENSKRRHIRIEQADYLDGLAETEIWSDRLELGQRWTIEDVSYPLARTVRVGYTPDSVIGQWNSENDELFGSYDYWVNTAQSSQPIMVRSVPIFTPSINATRICTDAPSASIVKTDDGDGRYQIEQLTFPTKVVRYEGMRSLPEGESWGWPSYAGEYPYLAFHAPDDGFTLCFEDRDGVAGLHKYYDREARIWCSAKRITVYVRLTTHQVMNLFEPSTRDAALHKKFEVVLDGERHLCTLEQLEYTVGEASAKCTFIKID